MGVRSQERIADMTSRIITYADSAVSDHFFVEQSKFMTYTANTDHKGSTTAVAGAFPILGTGNVHKSTIYKGRRVELTFENALHAPSLTHNLVSNQLPQCIQEVHPV
jgi:hypothetical protein